ncbi:MAG: DUF2195 family protein [Gammaproteobacteria bacterium]|nr:DUF2195 family protein [Gammaproteobacteria bacterium]
MAAPRNSIFLALFLCACSLPTQADSVVINNRVEGCFALSKNHLDARGESLWVGAAVEAAQQAADCPCKSALFTYSAYQEQNQQTNKLVSGNFTTIGKASIELPVAVQKQLVFPDRPIYVDIVCGH